MLKHVVLFKFKDDSSEEFISNIVSSFLHLEKHDTGICAMEWGANISPENYHQGFTHCFSLSFLSLEHLEAYQVHPEHLKFQTVLKPHVERVFVIDYFAKQEL